MQLKRILFGIAASLAIAAAAVAVPGKEASAGDGYSCFTYRRGNLCDCSECVYKNCKCGSIAGEPETGESEIAN
jgi:hypothetical protein